MRRWRLDKDRHQRCAGRSRSERVYREDREQKQEALRFSCPDSLPYRDPPRQRSQAVPTGGDQATREATRTPSPAHVVDVPRPRERQHTTNRPSDSSSDSCARVLTRAPSPAQQGIDGDSHTRGLGAPRLRRSDHNPRSSGTPAGEPCVCCVVHVNRTSGPRGGVAHAGWCGALGGAHMLRSL